ncbi:unnamed protein product, partial [Allacma fusca]
FGKPRVRSRAEDKNKLVNSLSSDEDMIDITHQ